MTNDRDAFIHAIMAEPEDAPRLAFADWLDEHGEPERAEFIRLQCRLVADTEAPVEQRRAWRMRVLESLDEHASHWLGPWREFANAGSFIRGMLDYVPLRETDLLQQGEALFAHDTPLKVHLLHLDDPASPGVFACPTLSRFVGLQLSFSEGDNQRVLELARSPHLAGLRTLPLRGCEGKGELID